jgi:hypothetical protein
VHARNSSRDDETVDAGATGKCLARGCRIVLGKYAANPEAASPATYCFHKPDPTVMRVSDNRTHNLSIMT